VALGRGHETTLKKFYRRGKTVRLQPANSSMAPIDVPAGDVAIQGVVRGLLRRY
jgi:SOS-response transcriptional repressor LexA